MAAPTPRQTHRLAEVARLFFRLGTIGFGGPAAHIALMEDEVVRRRGWLSRERFLDYVGAVNLIPGPNSTELAIHIGHLRAGWPGLLVAGASFITPAMVIATLAGWAYVHYGALPEVAGILYGVKAVVIAIVARALWGLGRTALRTPGLTLLAAAAIVSVALGAHELLVLAAAGLIVVILRGAWRPGRRAIALVVLAAAGLGSSGAAAATAAAASPFSHGLLFLILAKIGSVLFGSGYVLLAFLRADFVERLGWLTEQQLLDAIAVGQVMPGPVFTTATFIGYVLGGPSGAAVATAGIFLPAFFFVAVSGPLIPRIRRSPAAGAALDGIVVASLALMAVVAWQLGRAALVDPLTIGLAVVSWIGLVRYRVNSTWLILLGALAGGLAAIWRG
jgi:chromate transporter